MKKLLAGASLAACATGCIMPQAPIISRTRFCSKRGTDHAAEGGGVSPGGNAVKRLLQTIGLIALGAFGTLALGAADFLTQAELDERLAKLRAELPAWIGVVHRDRCYQSAKGYVAYEYRCPTCGHSTGYRDKVGQGCMPGVSNTVAWARESVAKLRALRLDISIDERGFCDSCRSALMSGELRWSINGRSVNIYDRTDILILETFLKGERRLPKWSGPDWDIRSICHMMRLDELLGVKGKVNNWRPAYPLLKEDAREPHSQTNHPYGAVEVEVNI